MWPFSERRRHTRYAVDWNASLTCLFANREYKMEVTVIDISQGGARIIVPKMQVGSHHLLVDNDAGELELSVERPEGLFSSRIITRWFNWDDQERVFVVGVEFLSMAEEGRLLLMEYIGKL